MNKLDDVLANLGAILVVIPVILVLWTTMAFFIRFYFTGSFLP